MSGNYVSGNMRETVTEICEGLKEFDKEMLIAPYRHFVHVKEQEHDVVMLMKLYDFDIEKFILHADATDSLTIFMKLFNLIQLDDSLSGRLDVLENRLNAFSSKLNELDLDRGFRLVVSNMILRRNIYLDAVKRHFTEKEKQEA